MNAFWEDDRFWLRDIHLFDEHYDERYLATACPAAACKYDTLPLVEGFLWSGNVRAGLFPMRDGQALRGGSPAVEETGPHGLCIRWQLVTGAVMLIQCDERSLTITCPDDQWDLRVVWDERAVVPFHRVDKNAVLCSHEGFDYRVIVASGQAELTPQEKRLTFRPHMNKVQLILDSGRS